MELKEIIETYVYNPKDEILNIIIEKSKIVSKLALVNLVDYINKRIEEDLEVKENYIIVRNILLKALKSENTKNYFIDDNGRAVSSDEISVHKKMR